MSIESDLKKDGITVISKLDTLSVNTLARDVAEKICKTFPEQNFIFQNLFIALSRIPMYIADIPKGFAEATYFYKNSSMYFKKGLSLDELEKFAIHEFIHYLQEIKDKKGHLVRLGLCDYGDLKICGMGLNEGAVQLMASKALGTEEEIVKYYGISLPTNSPSYYPILCNLVKQMAYVTGEDVLYDSTFYGSTKFKERFANLCGSDSFYKIQENLDKIMEAEEKAIRLNNRLMSDECEGAKAQKISKKIEACKSKIKKLFFETQNTIYTSYFNMQFPKISTTADIDEYRVRLYNYKNYIGISDNYSDFNEFYINKMMDLDAKYEKIMNNTSLVAVDNSSSIVKFFKKIKLFLSATVELKK